MDDFSENERTVGHFVTLSGSIVIADGIHADSLPGGADQRVVLDLGKENCKIPVIAARQHGHNFLLIPVDAAIALPERLEETVEIEDPVTVPKDTDKASDGPHSK